MNNHKAAILLSAFAMILSMAASACAQNDDADVPMCIQQIFTCSELDALETCIGQWRMSCVEPVYTIAPDHTGGNGKTQSAAAVEQKSRTTVKKRACRCARTRRQSRR
jgi:hypothetical protein